MAKPLRVEFAGRELDFTLEKVDRSKLYGYVETEVLDETGKRCELATLIGDGHSVVGKGGTALAYLSQDGLWRKKADLKPIDVHSQPIAPVKSTFDATVVLDATASVDEYLSHNVMSVYQLALEGDGDATELLAELKAGTIFRFPFSFRGGLEASAGFLLLGADGNLFLCVGTATALEFLGPTATAAVVQDADTADEEEDALDFSLV